MARRGPSTATCVTCATPAGTTASRRYDSATASGSSAARSSSRRPPRSALSTSATCAGRAGMTPSRLCAGSAGTDRGSWRGRTSTTGGASRSFNRQERDLRSLGALERPDLFAAHRLGRLGAVPRDRVPRLPYFPLPTSPSSGGCAAGTTPSARCAASTPIARSSRCSSTSTTAAPQTPSSGRLTRSGPKAGTTSTSRRCASIPGRWQVCRHNDYRECREIGGSERELPRDWNDAISSLRPLRPFSND